MFRLAILCFIVWISTPSFVQESKAQKPGKSAIPVLKVKNDTGSSALQISKLSVDVAVVGDIAATTFDITFYNGLDKILEGEFEFPLADGQNISRYALDVNGKLREGVVVEKTKARVAFENTVRRKIDPGLAEKTKGNNFRTRIYPIPAKGYKRVVIAIEQAMGVVNKDLFYQLPLYTAERIGNFSIKTTVLATTVKPALKENGLTNFSFKKGKNGWLAEYSKENFIANNTIAFTIAPGGKSNNLAITEEHNGKTYFYLHSAIEGQYLSKPKPSSIVILWDISASAEKRNITKETALIEKYLSALQNVTVEVVPFNIVPQAKDVFIIKNGDASALIKHLKQYYFDGGTQLGAIDLKSYKGDEILLFSDGISTFGKAEIGFSSVPVTAINSSANADFSYLKHVVQQTNGKFADLTKMEAALAVQYMVKEPLHIISIRSVADGVEEIYTEQGTAIYNGFSVAGILKQASATITVDVGFGNTVTKSEVYTITKQEANEYVNVKRIWASMKIADLDLDYDKNKETITKLGKEFSIVTQNTSLLVLDRVEDYVEYDIVPPAELQKEYFALLKEKKIEKQDKEVMAFDEAVKAMQEMKKWWSKEFEPKNKKIEIVRFTPPRIAYDSEPADASEERGTAVSADTIAEVDYDRAFIGTRDTEGRIDEGFVARAVPPPPGAVEEEEQIQPQDVMLQEVVTTALKVRRKSTFSNEPNITLKEWKPDAEYLRALEQTSDQQHFKKYITLKKDYHNQPSFFVDVARFFYEKKNKTLALQVLSNVCEMKLEDAELLPVVANQLLETGETALAIETFKEILKIREEEPQSYRDLALAYNEAGQYDEAVMLLYKVLTGTWSDRFSGLKSVALNEMNAIISAHPDKVNTSGIDKNLIAAMPVDVRIVIGWSSDNSDIDLWVTEPNKEKCFYENKLTERGGRISGDITEGYGPEEYTIKKASDGDYIIEANLYGDSRQTLGGAITVKAELFTNFGRPTQKRKVINFRVMTNNEVVKIGSLSFAAKSGE